MKKVSKIVSLVLIAAMTLCLAGCGEKKSSNTLKFATNPEFPPFEYVSSNGIVGDLDGIDVAIAKQICDDNGYQIEFESMEFDSLLIALANGQVDVVVGAVTITDARKESVDFSIPYYVATQVIIVKEDSTIASAADLSDKLTAVVQGYTGETCVSDLGYKYESFKKGTECVMELVNGKCDAVVIDSATAEKYIKDNPGLKIVNDDSVFDKEEYGIPVKKGNTELLNKINATLEKMLAAGTIADLADKYCVAE